MRGRAFLLAAAASLGCAWSPFGREGPRGDPSHGVEVVEFEGVTEFHARALAFYQRLSHRRVNTYATYQDRVLREYFRNEQSFADYYADLSDDLDEAHFEQNRALQVEVAEFVFEGPGRALVRVRLVGEDAMPLRPGETAVEREDRWERRDGQWWIVPGKL